MSVAAMDAYRRAGYAVPAVRHRGINYIDLDAIDGRPLQQDDLVSVGQLIAMGEVAHAASPVCQGFPPFDTSSRLDALLASQAEGSLVSRECAIRAVERSPQGPVLYKDSNLRNWVVTEDGIYVAVDFESVTRAPAGYDLAKLLVSAHLTWGSIHSFDSIVDGYCGAEEHGLNREMRSGRVYLWCEVHWLLTAKYVGRNGYDFRWPDVRPSAISERSVALETCEY